MEFIVFNDPTKFALKKLPDDGTYITIFNPIANSEEIYFFYHLKELGYVEVTMLPGAAGICVCLTQWGMQIVFELKLLHLSGL